MSFQSKYSSQNDRLAPLSRARTIRELRRKSFLTVDTRFDAKTQGSDWFGEVQAFVMVGFYALVRFGFAEQLDLAGNYAGLIFDILFVVAAGWIYAGRIQFRNPSKRELLRGFTPMVFAGAFAMLLSKPLGLEIPFDVRGPEGILMLTLLGPVLEELLFRFALWAPLQDLGRKLKGESEIRAAVLSTLLFAYAHLNVAWFLPAGPVRNFVCYQTLYVLVLGGFASWRMMRTRSIFSAILAHVGFNLGFFIAILLV